MGLLSLVHFLFGGLVLSNCDPNHPVQCWAREGILVFVVLGLVFFFFKLEFELKWGYRGVLIYSFLLYTCLVLSDESIGFLSLFKFSSLRQLQSNSSQPCDITFFFEYLQRP
jgi:hypothetical protein